MLVLGFVLAWFIGGVLGAELLARLWPGESLREQGSGNPGASNALRVRGKWFALLVLFWDMAKAALLLLLLAPWLLPSLGVVVTDTYLMLLGLALVAGHIWPPLHGFKGGKGVATAFAVLLILLPSVAPWLLLLWLVVFLLSGYSGLASAIAVLMLPIWAVATGDAEGGKPVMAFCMMLTALVLGAHRPNLQRLLRGEENRYRLPWLK